MKYFKFRKRSAVIHLTDSESNLAYCGRELPMNALVFQRKPSGRICVMCQNQKQEIEKHGTG